MLIQRVTAPKPAEVTERLKKVMQPAAKPPDTEIKLSEKAFTTFTKMVDGNSDAPAIAKEEAQAFLAREQPEPTGFVLVPLSNNHHTSHLKWRVIAPEDYPECDISAYSKVLRRFWYVSYTKHGRYRLTLGGMCVGEKDYGFISLAQTVAERCEDVIRKNPVAFADVMELLEKCVL